MSHELSDEEKSFHEWLEQNTGYVSQNKHSINVMKKLYLAGFAAGYMYKKQYNAMEQLQK
jgi:uncharacterized NAD(P)/FAD-binding protein YdhS